MNRPFIIIIAIAILFATTVHATFPIKHLPSNYFGGAGLAMLSINDSSTPGKDYSPLASNWANTAVITTSCPVFNELCGNFTATDEELTNADGLDNKVNNSLSVGGWFSMSSVNAGENNMLLSKSWESGNRLYIQIEPSQSRLKFGVGDNSDLFFCGNQGVALNAWYHLALVINHTGSGNGIATCYINGTFVANASYTGLNTFTAPWRVGENAAAGHDMDGKIAEVFIVNRTLSQGEITALYEGASTPGTPVFTNISVISGPVPGDDIPPYTTSDTYASFRIDTDVPTDCRMSINEISYTAMGSARNCTLWGSGQNSTQHDCTITDPDEFYNSTSFIYVICKSIATGLEASTGQLPVDVIDLDASYQMGLHEGFGVNGILSYSRFMNQTVFLRSLNGTQVMGRPIGLAVNGTKRWIVNVPYDNRPALSLFNITPSVYSYEEKNIGPYNMGLRVASFVNATND